MSSIRRQLRRGSLKVIENKITGRLEIFRKGKHSPVFTGYSFKDPKSEINL